MVVLTCADIQPKYDQFSLCFCLVHNGAQSILSRGAGNVSNKIKGIKYNADVTARQSLFQCLPEETTMNDGRKERC